MKTIDFAMSGFHNNTLNEAEAIGILTSLSDAYHEGEPLATDEDFDRLYKLAQDTWPDNHFFRKVGAKVRGAELQHSMPVAGLKQLYTLNDINIWMQTKKPVVLIASEKLDGGSGTVTYNKGQLTLAATRGDGVTGKDITRHLLKFTSLPHSLNHFLALDQEDFSVRGELIISKRNFPIVRDILLRVKGREYKNARNTITGLINAKEIPDEVFPYLDFVAYDIAGCDLDKSQQFHYLAEMGFKVPWWSIIELSKVETSLDQHFNSLVFDIKEKSEYECDGIVIELYEGSIRAELMPTLDDLNPGYAFKWKIVNEIFIGEVIGVEWNITAYDYMKPVVLIKPTEVGGVTISRLSGFNASFIFENKIGIGAKVKFQRAGDVIPDILEVIEGTEPMMPSVDWDWNETGVDAIALETTERAHILRLKNFFAGLEIDNLKDASLQRLYEEGFTELLDIIELTEPQLNAILGKNGSKTYFSLQKVLQNCDLAALMGSYPKFGRGFGTRKAKMLLDKLGDAWRTAEVSQIITVEGYSDKSAAVFLCGRRSFIEFLDYLLQEGIVTLKQAVTIDGELSGQSFAFTGVRSSDAEERIKAKGGIIHDGVKKDTTVLIAKDPKATSGKLEKARKQGIKIISLSELYDMLGPTQAEPVIEIKTEEENKKTVLIF
jgi:NAD-dependent DNA ligase